MDLINSYKDIVSLNLREYENLEEETKRIIITDEMKEVILTSDNITCNCSIFVNKRNTDLTIIINNLNINSKKEITIDLRGSIEYQYKTYLIYSGENLIKSEENIGICISNDKVVEIIAKENGMLNVQSGKGAPAIGNNFYTSGRGEIIFSGDGNINAIAGAGSNKKDIVTWAGENGAYAIGLYNDTINEISKISILDSVILKARGEDGQSIRSISASNKAGDGGSAIYSNMRIEFEKSSNGKLELIGGDGGRCIGEYFCGICGNGGNAICINSGSIFIKENSILNGGNGGSVDNKLCIAKGGNGGDVILISKDKLDYESEESVIKIYDSVNLKGGDGGDSGIGIYNSQTSYIKGGDGGSIINANYTKIEVDKNIENNITLGISGICLQNIYEEKGKDGEVYLGDKITVKELEYYNLSTNLEEENLNILSIGDINILNFNEEDKEILVNENINNNENYDKQEILESDNENDIEKSNDINLIECKSINNEIKIYKNYYEEIFYKIILFIKNILFK